MVEARVQGGNRSSGISKRVTLIQESGYNSNERARGDKGRVYENECPLDKVLSCWMLLLEPAEAGHTKKLTKYWIKT